MATRINYAVIDSESINLQEERDRGKIMHPLEEA